MSAPMVTFLYISPATGTSATESPLRPSAMITGAPTAPGVKPWSWAVIRWETDSPREPTYSVLQSVTKGRASAAFAASTKGLT